MPLLNAVAYFLSYVKTIQMFSIITVEREDTKCDKVCAIVSRNDGGESIVLLTAWHFNGEGDEYIQEETITMPSFQLACGFVDDFSQSSAQVFVDSFNF